MKVVINECWGGFGLSKDAIKRLVELGDTHIKKMTNEEYYGNTARASGTTIKEERERDMKWSPQLFLDSDLDHIYSDEHRWKDELRSCSLLVQVVEELKDKADAEHANLIVVEVPDNIEYEIDEYDGQETVDEKHRSWR